MEVGKFQLTISLANINTKSKCHFLNGFKASEKIDFDLVTLKVGNAENIKIGVSQ